METQRSKRRRVYSYEPPMQSIADFAHSYLAYLLPALLKIERMRSRRRIRVQEVEEAVKAEVNLALVAAAGGFAWSRALEQKLRHCTARPPSILSLSREQKNSIDGGAAVPPSTSGACKCEPERAGASSSFSASEGKPLEGGNDELQDRMRILRRILPGGEALGLTELISGVNSYVVCLELQVDVLRSLVDTS
ncbi:unnamed protein product [Spirodela intermedia]|uniref:IBH1-like N-terminal domain-containing protein n=2 Tax=Spirodela intermedia TaxID=51605 RepID=A0A7I8LJ58_SPIIN|nr:unnamed protein product [Spirodela intermedia]CAA6672189.1 unnamed protein product [Spirodela intermedia]CAA7409348.1 unnamed protein product [Spirodela intermedia]